MNPAPGRRPVMPGTFDPHHAPTPAPAAPPLEDVITHALEEALHHADVCPTRHVPILAEQLTPRVAEAVYQWLNPEP